MNKIVRNIKMKNTLQNIIKKLRLGSNLEVINEYFSNEIILNQSVQCSILGGTTFFKVDFRNIDFTGSHMIAFNFKDCIFDNVTLVKCEFWDSTFENCQIENSNLARVDFYDSKFKNCNFINVNLKASYFSNFEFIETKFKNSQMNSIIVSSVKVSRSEQSIEVEDFFSFEKTLKDMNLIIFTNQNGTESYLQKHTNMLSFQIINSGKGA